MNVSAPNLAPDLAGLALLLAAPTDMPAPNPGFAPSPLLKAGAEIVHSFQSALADLLPAASESQREPDSAESKTLVTGVAVTTPVPAPEALPLRISMPHLQPALEANTAPVANGKPQPQVPSPGVPLVPTPALPESKLAEPEPQPAPAAAPPDEAPAEPELENIAFVERFTPVPVDTAPNPPFSVPSIRRVLSADAAGQPAVKPQAGAPSPQPAAAAPVTSAAKPESPAHGMEQRQENQQPQHSRSAPEASTPQTEFTPPARAEVRAEMPVPMAQPAPPARETASPEARPVETRLPDPDPIGPPAPAPHMHSSEARTISLRVTESGDQRVDLKITERQGEVHVAVRAADADLAGSLRENLGELVHKLEQSGLRAESWQPTQSTTASGNHMDRQADKESGGGQRSGQEQQHHSRDGRQDRRQDPERRRWIDEIENTLASETERKIWFPA